MQCRISLHAALHGETSLFFYLQHSASLSDDEILETVGDRSFFKNTRAFKKT